MKLLIKYPTAKQETEFIIPDGVTSIDDSAFYDCQSLTSITIPDSVKSIGKFAFYDCRSLKNITLPDSFKSIDEYAFNSDIKIIICKGDVKVPFMLKGNWNKKNAEILLNNFITADVNNRQEYFDKLKPYYKIPLALFMASAYPQETYYPDYLKNNAEDAGRYLVDTENIDLFYRFLDFGFVTEKNIDSLISHAVKHTQNGGSAEFQLVLSKYRNDNFSAKGADVFDKLML